MYKAILFDIENTLLYPKVSVEEQLAALELDGASLFTAASAREAVRQAELWMAGQILRELETNTRMEDDVFFENVLHAYVRNASEQNEGAADVIRRAILAARGTQNDMPKALHKPDGLPALLEALSARYTLASSATTASASAACSMQRGSRRTSRPSRSRNRPVLRSPTRAF